MKPFQAKTARAKERASAKMPPPNMGVAMPSAAPPKKGLKALFTKKKDAGRAPPY
jgi:hypothetical protein